MSGVYYNENDKYCVQWLRNLIAAGHLPAGDVDDRSIVDVSLGDLGGYVQHHFFAGIGGWPYALRLAGWPAARPVWTGSCPCQPFSSAGKRNGAKDERHLWPHWFNLIRECKPAVIFGENVDAAIGWGWLDAVCTDLEAEGYATGAAVLPACGVGAPHIRNRVWFVADADGGNASTERLQRGGQQRQQSQDGRTHAVADAGELADAERAGWPEGRTVAGDGSIAGGGLHGMGDASSEQARLPRQSWSLGDAELQFNGTGDAKARWWRESANASPWGDLEWITCTDGKARPAKPGIFPLASRIPGRVGQLRAAGNSVVPQVAAEFVSAFMRIRED